MIWWFTICRIPKVLPNGGRGCTSCCLDTESGRSTVFLSVFWLRCNLWSFSSRLKSWLSLWRIRCVFIAVLKKVRYAHGGLCPRRPMTSRTSYESSKGYMFWMGARWSGRLLMVPSHLERKGRSSFKVFSAEVAVVLLCGSTINQPGCWENRVFCWEHSWQGRAIGLW